MDILSNKIFPPKSKPTRKFKQRKRRSSISYENIRDTLDYSSSCREGDSSFERQHSHLVVKMQATEAASRSSEEPGAVGVTTRMSHATQSATAAVSHREGGSSESSKQPVAEAEKPKESSSQQGREQVYEQELREDTYEYLKQKRTNLKRKFTTAMNSLEKKAKSGAHSKKELAKLYMELMLLLGEVNTAHNLLLDFCEKNPSEYPAELANVFYTVECNRDFDEFTEKAKEYMKGKKKHPVASKMATRSSKRLEEERAKSQEENAAGLDPTSSAAADAATKDRRVDSAAESSSLDEANFDEVLMGHAKAQLGDWSQTEKSRNDTSGSDSEVETLYKTADFETASKSTPKSVLKNKSKNSKSFTARGKRASKLKFREHPREPIPESSTASELSDTSTSSASSEEPVRSRRRRRRSKSPDWEPSKTADCNEGNLLVGMLMSNINVKEQVRAFGGSAKDWPEFFLSWQEVDQKLAVAGKTYFARLVLLKTVLKDEALRLISALPPVNDSYPTALKILRKAYEDKQAIVASAVREVHLLPKMESNPKEFAIRVATIARNFTTLGLTQSDLSLSMLLNQIVRKLAPRVKTEWVKKTLKHQDGSTLGHSLNMDDLISIIDQYVLVEDKMKDFNPKKDERTGHKDKKSESSKGANSQSQPKPANPNSSFNMSQIFSKEFLKNSGLKPIQAAYSVADSSRKSSSSGNRSDKNRRERQMCPFCKKERHSGWRCEKLKRMSFDEIERIARDKKLCRICLNDGHRSKDCKSREKFPCAKCNKVGHRDILCRAGKEKSDTNSRRGFSNQLVACNATGASFANAWRIDGKFVEPILEVLKCNLFKVNSQGVMSNSPIPVSVMLDSGSTMTFLESAFAEKHRLEGEKCKFSVLAGTGAASEQSRFVKFCLADNKGRFPPIRVEAYTTTNLTFPNLNVEVNFTKDELNTLKTFALSYDLDKPFGRVQLLLGQPFYQYIQRGIVGTGPNGLPLVMDSVIGQYLTCGRASRQLT